MSTVPPETPRPPRPPNAYILFRQFLNKFIAVHPKFPEGLSQHTISKLSSVIWRLLDHSPDVKDYFYGQADEAAMKHRQKYPNYRYSPKRKASPHTKPLTAKARHTCLEKKSRRGSASSMSGAPQMTSASVSRVLDSLISRMDVHNPSLPFILPPPPPYAPHPIAHHSPASHARRRRAQAPKTKWTKPVYCFPFPYQTQSITAAPSNGSVAWFSPFNMGLGPIQTIESTAVDHEEITFGAHDFEADTQSSSSSDSGEDSASFTDEDMDLYFDFSEFSME